MLQSEFGRWTWVMNDGMETLTEALTYCTLTYQYKFGIRG